MARDVAQPSYEELVAENAALRQRLAELGSALKTALEQVEAARRAGKRQAAPFSKGPPKEHAQPPGGKVGHAPTHRAKPKQAAQASCA